MVVACLYELSFTDFDVADPPAQPPDSRSAFDIVKFSRYQKHFNSPVHSKSSGLEIIMYFAHSGILTKATYRMSKCAANCNDQKILDVRLFVNPFASRPPVRLVVRPPTYGQTSSFKCYKDQMLKAFQNNRSLK